MSSESVRRDQEIINRFCLLFFQRIGKFEISIISFKKALRNKVEKNEKKNDSTTFKMFENNFSKNLFKENFSKKKT